MSRNLVLMALMFLAPIVLIASVAMLAKFEEKTAVYPARTGKGTLHLFTGAFSMHF
jgi:hypothetical protein